MSELWNAAIKMQFCHIIFLFVFQIFLSDLRRCSVCSYAKFQMVVDIENMIASVYISKIPQQCWLENLSWLSLLHLCIVSWLAFGFELTSSKYSKCTAWFFWSIYECVHSSWDGTSDVIAPIPSVLEPAWKESADTHFHTRKNTPGSYWQTLLHFDHCCYKSPLEQIHPFYFCVALSIVMCQYVTRTLRCNGTRNNVVTKVLGKFCSAGFLLQDFGFALDEVMWEEHLFIRYFCICTKGGLEVHPQHLLHSYKLSL